MYTDEMIKVDTRSVDDLGRVVLPRSLRLAYQIQEGDEVAFYDNGTCILLRKAESCCCICRSLEELCNLEGKTICRSCLEKIRNM